MYFKKVKRGGICSMEGVEVYGRESIIIEAGGGVME